MRLISANGEVHEVEEDADGYVDIGRMHSDSGSAGRALIVQHADGSNEILPPAGKSLVRPGDVFVDAPRAERGR